MPKSRFIYPFPDEPKGRIDKLRPRIEAFLAQCEPLESPVYVLVDNRTGAFYCECHVKASKLIELGTIDVPLDPEGQSDYRANREIVEDHAAYEQMCDDALKNRSFSNLVTEFVKPDDEKAPLSIIGGQHRFEAIKQARNEEIDEYHGIKVYFDLTADQRLDVQLISNTNIAVSGDLLDRMYETVAGPQLRDWCQGVEILEAGQDFADRRQRGNPITVRAARTLIMNFFAGKMIGIDNFGSSRTTPSLTKTGVDDPEWRHLKEINPSMWSDGALKNAGKEFAKLVEAQRAYFLDDEEGRRANIDFAEKALNYAVLSAWAYIAGLLSVNPQRLKRHFNLRERSGKDPLNAAVLAKGRHKSDPDNYRGLGYRTDAKERGRFVELFYLHAEKGEGINKALVDLAIKKYHAKQAILEVKAAEEKA